MTELSLLLLADTRGSWHFINSLVFHEEELNHKYDFVLLAGGMGDSPNEAGKPIDAQIEQKAQEIQKETLDKLATLLDDSNKHSKVIYVPGVSDAHSTFEEDLDMSKKWVNAHRQVIELDDGLLLAGLGGALPV